MSTEHAWISLAISGAALLVLVIYTFLSSLREPEDYLVVTINPGFVCDPCAKAPRGHCKDICRGGTYCDCQHKGCQAPKDDLAQAA